MATHFPAALGEGIIHRTYRQRVRRSGAAGPSMHFAQREMKSVTGGAPPEDQAGGATLLQHTRSMDSEK